MGKNSVETLCISVPSVVDAFKALQNSRIEIQNQKLTTEDTEITEENHRGVI